MTADLSFDTTDTDFETAVLERSLDVPVLLDCWAPWCGPCRALTPLLDKLVAAYRGRFVLAKLNTDTSPQVSSAMGIRSIPQVTLFIGGQPVDQFMGALPESQIRQFLDSHLAPEAAAEDDGPDGAPEDADPDPLDEAEALIAEGALADARALLDLVPPEVRDDRHAQLLGRLRLADERPEGDAAALAARIAADPKDFEARFEIAALLVHAGDFPAAFEQLLAVVLRDKGDMRERARVQLVEWFALCPDTAAVSQGRRYLGMYLN